MGTRNSRELPRSASADSPVMRHNAELLKAAGVTLDASGKAVFASSGDDGGGNMLEEERPSSPYSTMETGEETDGFGGGESAESGEGQHLEREEPQPSVAPESEGKGLEKREADARNAQRDMTKARGALKEILEEANAAIARLTELRDSVDLKIPDLNPAAPEDVEEYRRLYPVEYSVMESIVKPIYDALQQIHAQYLALVDSMADGEKRKVSRSSISAVEHFVPNPKAIVASEAFRTWIFGLSGAIRGLYVDIVENTQKYEPGDVLKMFSDYENTVGAGIFANEWAPGAELDFEEAPQVKAVQRPSVQPRSLDRGRGMGSGGAMPRAARVQAPGRAATELTPLTPEEMANFQSLIARATPQDAAILRKRLALTNPVFTNNPYMVEGHK